MIKIEVIICYEDYTWTTKVVSVPFGIEGADVEDWLLEEDPEAFKDVAYIGVYDWNAE